MKYNSESNYKQYGTKLTIPQLNTRSFGMIFGQFM